MTHQTHWADVNVAVEVEAAPEEVWEVVSDVRRLPHWQKHVARVDDVPPEGLDVGSTYTTVMRFMRVRARVEAEVLEWDPPRRSRIRLSGMHLIDAVVTTVVSPLPGGRSLLQHDVEYRFHGGALGELAARSLALLGGPHHALRHGTLAQKHEIELG